MKKIYDSPAEKQEAYRERKKEEAEERAQCIARNLCSFSEIGFETPASSCQEEIQVHRSWLRALGQPDVLENESLKDLARRTWLALLNSSDLGVTTDGGGKWVDRKWVPGFDVWLPYFDPSLQDFQVWLGERIYGGAKPVWFDAHWVPPKDCSGDEIISIEDLPNLPPMKSKRAA